MAENINPFLTPMADALWEELDKGGKPLSKQELLKRIREAKSNKEAARKRAVPPEETEAFIRKHKFKK